MFIFFNFNFSDFLIINMFQKVEMSSANAKMTVDGGGPRSSRFIMAQKNLGLMLEIIRKDPESYKEAWFSELSKQLFPKGYMTEQKLSQFIQALKRNIYADIPGWIN